MIHWTFNSTTSTANQRKIDFCYKLSHFSSSFWHSQGDRTANWTHFQCLWIEMTSSICCAIKEMNSCFSPLGGGILQRESHFCIFLSFNICQIHSNCLRGFTEFANISLHVKFTKSNFKLITHTICTGAVNMFTRFSSGIHHFCMSCRGEQICQN